MINELLFLTHTIILAASCAGTLWFGKEALCAFVCLQTIFANIFILKQIMLFGFTATAADAYSVAAAISITLLQERFGFTLAKKTIWISFYLMILYTIVSQLHLAYQPSLTDVCQQHYYLLFSCMPRIMSASLFAFFVSQLVDTHCYRLLKRLFPTQSFTLLGTISVAFSQLCDTFLFTFLALRGLTSNWTELFFISYLIKMAANLLIMFGLRASRAFLPKTP